MRVGPRDPLLTLLLSGVDSELFAACAQRGVVGPDRTGAQQGGCDEMDIDIAQPSSHEIAILYKEQDLFMRRGLSLGKRMEKLKDFSPPCHASAGQLADDKRVDEDFSAFKKFREARHTRAEMIDPNRGINKDHGDQAAGLLRGMGRSFFSVPPSMASRRLLSRAINASNPRLTRAVFSLIPVSWDAFFKVSSSIFRVVLICIYMHCLYIYVKRPNISCPPTVQTDCREMSKSLQSY